MNSGMNVEHPLRKMVRGNHSDGKKGMFSVCSGNRFVLLAAVRYAKEHDCTVIIEATSNQVNQYGGYTGMLPQQFADMVWGIVEQEGLDPEKVILGGDHLGPLIWQDEPEESAMEKAKELVRQFTLAGYTKIHLDTSMRVGDDDPDLPFPVEVSARRGAELARTVEEVYKERCREYPDALHPALVIGSEVPVPGGSKEHEEGITPTDPEEFRSQLECFEQMFVGQGLDLTDVVAFVVQPGVEFGDDFVFQYDRKAAKDLTDALKDYDGIVFEGHSTDYQTTESLTNMVDDGIAILKVGPALTFALREALMSLESIEKRLIPNEGGRSFFEKTLMDAMDNDGRYWKAYYQGTPDEIQYKKLFSYSDRCRYYMPVQEVDGAVSKLLSNLDGELPPALISQYFPDLFEDVQRGEIKPYAVDMIVGHIGKVLDRYSRACKCF